ncbi:MAG: alpha/beta hydrolase [Candidatus Competibacteraceae bacterium]|nr:alpha/beta hydrolase [Candidatus Competibacteraceae bacterium]
MFDSFSLLRMMALVYAMMTLSPSWANPPPLSGRFDVGGFALHMDCWGQGNPVVVLDAGLAHSSRGWGRIIRDLSGTARVCAYDRAGYGLSDPGPLPRTSSRMAAELRTLLERAQIPPPFLLVGHSLGGHNMRMFAGLYPHETAGLILVDAPHEALVQDFLESYFMRLIDPHGVLQQLWQPGLLAELNQVDLAPLAPLIGMKPNVLRTALNEVAAFQESSRELRALGIRSEVPLVVIMHGYRVFPSTPMGDQMEQAWLAWQRDFAARHRYNRFIIAQRSGHDIPGTEPEVISSAVRLLLDLYR